MRLFLSLFLFVSITCSILILSALACSAQQPVSILKRFNQHSYEDRYNGHRDGFLDIKDGTNFFNRYELMQTENAAWPPSLSNASVTNYYIWSFISANGQFVVTDSVQWINVPGVINLILINQPLPAGVTPRFPYPHIGTKYINTVYTTLENKGDSQLLITRSMNSVPGLDYNKAWYYRLNCYMNGEFHTGVALNAGGTRILCINQSELVDGSNHYFSPPGFFDGAYSASPVEFIPLNPSHVLATGTDYSAPSIPTRHSILEGYISGYFNPTR